METRTHSRYPLGLIWSLGFLAGIVTCFIFQTFLGLFFVVTLLFFFWKTLTAHVRGRYFLWFVLFLFFGFFYYRFFIFTKNDAVQRLNAAGTLSGVVSSVSVVEPSDLSYVLDTAAGVSVTVFDRLSSSTSDISYGTHVFLSGYQLAGERLFIRYPKHTVVVGKPSHSFVGFLIQLREAATRILFLHLPLQSAALASGILFGDTSGFSKQMKDMFAVTGTTHIVALSGYNVMLIAFFVQICLSRFLNRRIVFLFTLVALALFVVVTGASASSVRAAVMYGIFGVAYELGRGRVGILAAVYGAAIMNVYDPTMAVSNIGFQLSFASLLGVVILAPRLLVFAQQTFLMRYPTLAELFCTALAAQLATLPFIVWYFGTVSALSVFVNVLVSVLVPFATAGAFALVVFGSFSYFLAWPISLVTNTLLQFQLSVIAIASRLPFHTTVMGIWGKILICGACILCIGLLLGNTGINNEDPPAGGMN